MPLIFRSMVHENGKPTVGCESNMLGVRVPPHSRPDVSPDESINVGPGSGGMSVAPDWRTLPFFLIPQRLKHLVPHARGTDSLMCFQFGEGTFEQTRIDSNLNLVVSSVTHGTVQPVRRMALEDFQQALANTRESWALIEEEHRT